MLNALIDEMRLEQIRTLVQSCGLAYADGE